MTMMSRIGSILVSGVGCDTQLALTPPCYLSISVIIPYFDHNLFPVVFGQEKIIMDVAAAKTNDINYTADVLVVAAQSDAYAAATDIVGCRCWC